ncbi:MAG: hypothetical protein WCT50_01245 [Patescibacteria group bacterium]
MTKSETVSSRTSKKLVIRRAWLEKENKWVFSVIDVLGIMAQSKRPRKYWADFKVRLMRDQKELFSKIGQLKMKADDGKMYNTDVADINTVFHLIRSIPALTIQQSDHWLYLKIMFALRKATKSPLGHLNLDD